MTWKTNTPLHVREGHATQWRPHFAICPVRLEQGGWAWMRKTYRRVFIPAPWFTAGPAWWWEYSDVKRCFWETGKIEDCPSYQRGFEAGAVCASQDRAPYIVPEDDNFDRGWNAGMRSVFKDTE